MHGSDRKGRQALERLMAGNRRFRAGTLKLCPTMEDILALKDGQSPFAAILACADSRVPPNLLFGCSLGELFVVRTAGNVLSDLELGSLEYAVACLHVPLVMVLGHSGCGAVESAVGAGEAPGALGKVLAEIAPSVERAREKAENAAQLTCLAEDYNALHAVDRLRRNEVLRAFPDTLVVGAKYDLRTGEVSLLPDEAERLRDPFAQGQHC